MTKTANVKPKQGQPAMKVRDLLAARLDVTSGDDHAMLQALSALTLLPRQIRLKADELDLPLEHTKRLDDVERMLASTSLNGNIQGLIRSINDTHLDELERLSSYFHRHSPEPAFDAAMRASVLEQVEELRATIETDEALPTAVRESLLFHVSRMNDALGLVPILGTDPLLNEVYRGFGDIAFSAAAHPLDEASMSSLGRYWEYLARMADLLQVGSAVAITAQAMMKLTAGG